MSGFEVAGIVLGSIPLVISALEHYRDGVSTIQRWRKYDRELQSLIRNLNIEKVKFQNICEKLLLGLVSPSHIELMIETPFGIMWRHEAVRRKMRARLSNSFDVFESTVEDMRSAISEMMRRLDLDPAGKVCSPRLHNHATNIAEKEKTNFLSEYGSNGPRDLPL